MKKEILKIVNFSKNKYEFENSKDLADFIYKNINHNNLHITIKGPIENEDIIVGTGNITGDSYIETKKSLYELLLENKKSYLMELTIFEIDNLRKNLNALNIKIN